VLSVTPKSGSPPLNVTADACASTDTDGTPIASYRFSFGDGSSTVVVTPPTCSTQHTYTAAGNFTVTATVTDTANQPSTANVRVQVKRK